MSDRYQSIANSALGGMVTRRLGLPTPPRLERHRPGKQVVSGPVLVGAARGGRMEAPVRDVLRAIGAHVAEGEGGEEEYAALIYDATGVDGTSRLRALYDFFHPVIRSLARNGRVVVLASPPEDAGTAPAQTAQRAVEGFVRSVGKEIGGKGATAQLVQVAEGAEGAMESTLRFLLSARSAYVSGQVIWLGAVEPEAVRMPSDWDAPLEGRVAAVTGAARGIGKAIVETLARDGAHVIAIDVPSAGEALSRVANEVGGAAMQLDITDPAAPERLADFVVERHGMLDAIVHNAGITRDKTLGRMTEDQWDAVLGVNLIAPEAITARLLARDLIGAGGRVIGVSSVSGIAGNRGQANYATSKAGVIGLVQSLAGPLSERAATINAVAPGFIETEMTAAMPLGTREAGRRTNSLVQGGQPVDVAETVGWLAAEASAAVNGNVVRVCGQALIGS